MDTMRPAAASLALTALAAAVLSPLGADAAPLKAAVFDFELVDTSEEGARDGIRQDQTDRLRRIEQQVKDRLKQAGVELVDVGPAHDELNDVKSLRDCLKCAEDAAKKLGADVAVVGYVQKVSNLILNINLEIHDARTGKLIRAGSTDIRGNTDEMWDHGASFLMRNQILKDPLPQGLG